MKAPTAMIAPILGLLGLGLGVSPALADPSCEGPNSTTTLTVQVSGMNAAKGEMAITIYPSDPKKFLARTGKLLRVRTATVAPTTSACFNLPAAGVYAVAVYHDANADSDFNRSVIGMPTEGFGFSNDAPTKFGLPAFDTVKFPVKAGANSIRVKLRYVN
jgi:uncharacterized protein (DUF2141 family)